MRSRLCATFFRLWLAFFAIGTAVLAGHADPVTVKFVSENSVVAPGERVYLGLQFKLEPHWHIYWKNPGSNGYGVTVDWDLPEGVTVGSMEWPAPQKFAFDGFINYGYSDSATLLVPLHVDASVVEPIHIRASVSWLACETACVPGSAELAIHLPLADKAVNDSERIEFFHAARAALPLEVNGPQPVFELEAGKMRIQIPDTKTETAYFYAEEAGWIDVDAPQELTRKGDSVILAVQLLEEEPLAGITGVLETDGVFRQVVLEAAVTKPVLAGGRMNWEAKLLSMGLVGWVVLAFLGGVILNIMPCVLPVLSLKVFSLLKHAGQTRSQALAYGLAYTLGVVLSFVALASLLFILRGLGERIGWGFQLQNPAFVVALTLLLFVFALNLIGVFEMGMGLVGADAKVARRKDWVGSFGTGVLAAVVGAPCVGPLVGGASGVALQADAWTGIFVFAMMGFGMAAPFLLLSLFPKLAGFLPKPGPWMEVFKQLMGFVLFAVVVFLLWVTGQSGGTDGIVALLLALLVAALAAWIYGRWAAVSRPKGTRRIATLLAVLLLGIAFGVSAQKVGQAYATEQGKISGADAESIWQPWSEQRVASELAAGRPVFVDFTASWCLICQVNKRTTLRTRATRELFEAHRIVALEADWTRYDAAITDALEAQGRSGVPLYLLHTPDGQTQVLPQNLTPAIVRQAVESAL
jgi:thiol:disulfide interchange protein DsbD